MRLYKQTIAQEKMGQLLHKFWPKRRTGGHETHFGDGAALFIPERSLWISYDGGSHSVLQVFHTTFICHPHYLLKLWCRGSHTVFSDWSRQSASANSRILHDTVQTREQQN